MNNGHAGSLLNDCQMFADCKFTLKFPDIKWPMFVNARGYIYAIGVAKLSNFVLYCNNT